MIIPTPIILTNQEIVRFWSYVKKGNPMVCWEWQGAQLKGYGVFSVYTGKYRTYRAHRIAYAVTYGDTNQLILHSCNNPGCCNPVHLRAGTNKENMQQAARENRMASPKGSRNGMAKLSESDVQYIRKCRATKVPLKILATLFDVSVNHVQWVASYKCWKHI